LAKVVLVDQILVPVKKICHGLPAVLPLLAGNRVCPFPLDQVLQQRGAAQSVASSCTTHEPVSSVRSYTCTTHEPVRSVA